MFSGKSLGRLALAIVVAGSFAGTTLAQAGAAPAAAPTGKPADPNQVLYALGVVVANQLKSFSLTEAELVQVQKGLADGVLKRGNATTLDLAAIMPEVQKLNNDRVAKTAVAESAAAETWLTQRAGEAGAQKTASGLIYKELKAGTGASPAATDKVKVHYHGTLRTGEVFDSSVQRGEPATFGLNQVIPCWTEAVQKMKVGGKALISCPSKIAYGDKGNRSILPGAALSFEVELLEIVK
jgi:FKBP-type peptidyl-prolyl cis-trans isomerase FkpA